MELISKRELMLGNEGPLAGLAAGALMSVLGINNLNRLYSATYSDAEHCASNILSLLNISYDVCDHDLANIPQSGGVVVIANHPTGGLEGVLLIDMLSKIRSDVKIIGNFMLNRIEPLNRYFIPIDSFRDKDPRSNVKALKQAHAHVCDGGALVVFPAGEVSSWNRQSGRICDRVWGRSMIRFIRDCQAPVVPIFVEARNSKKFYALGSLHPIVRTALLPREFTNKRNLTVPVSVGSPVTERHRNALEGIDGYGRYLRASVEYLRHPSSLNHSVKTKEAHVVREELERRHAAATDLKIEVVAGCADRLSRSVTEAYLMECHPYDPLSLSSKKSMTDLPIDGSLMQGIKEPDLADRLIRDITRSDFKFPPTLCRLLEEEYGVIDCQPDSEGNLHIALARRPE